MGLSGSRSNAFTAQLAPIVADLNNEELEALAEYLSKLETARQAAVKVRV